MFFYIRVFSVAIVALWLLSVAAQTEAPGVVAREVVMPMLPLLLWFFLYGSLMQFLTKRFADHRGACRLLTAALDAVFVTLLVRQTGRLQSSFFLAYYLLIMTNTFSMGLAAGGVMTFLATTGYLYLYIETPNDLFLGDLLLRVGFLYLVFFAMAVLTEKELREKFSLGERQRKLEASFEELVDEKKQIEKTAEETSELLRFQRDVTERRQDHLRFAKEINALASVDEIVKQFHRYISRLILADDVSIALFNRDGTPPTLYSMRDSKMRKKSIRKSHPVLRETLAASGNDELRKWNAPPGGRLSPDITLVDFPVCSMWAEALGGGESGMAGVLAVSYKKTIEADPDRMDEVRILCSHCAVAVENLKLRERLEELAETDALTGTYNRRHFQRSLERELRRSERYSRSLALVMMDIDHFKRLNDEYGHPAGDAVLKGLAAVVDKTTRNIDIFARYGGEEFVLILPETHLEGAAELAERLRGAVETHEFPVSDDEKIHVTISLGVAVYPAAKTAEALVQAADDALYRAKEAGRNRMVTAEPGEVAG